MLGDRLLAGRDARGPHPRGGDERGGSAPDPERLGNTAGRAGRRGAARKSGRPRAAHRRARENARGRLRLTALPSLPADRPFDLVGVGLNAVDTLVVVPEYPAFNAKVEILEHARTCGGQVATALVACRRWGLRVRYVGAGGDDEQGRFQRESLALEGIELDHLKVVPGAFTQMSVIIVEKRSGERTILWRRDPRLVRDPREIPSAAVAAGRVLLVDGHELPLSIHAPRAARD